MYCEGIYTGSHVAHFDFLHTAAFCTWQRGARSQRRASNRKWIFFLITFERLKKAGKQTTEKELIKITNIKR